MVHHPVARAGTEHPRPGTGRDPDRRAVADQRAMARAAAGSAGGPTSYCAGCSGREGRRTRRRRRRRLTEIGQATTKLTLRLGYQTPSWPSPDLIGGSSGPPAAVRSLDRVARTNRTVAFPLTEAGRPVRN